jgi:hypothetical protein
VLSYLDEEVEKSLDQLRQTDAETPALPKTDLFRRE